MHGHILPASIQIIADSVGVTKLGYATAEVIARNVEAKLRDIIEDAARFMRHGGRDILTTDDIGHSLRLKTIEPLYGYTSSDPITFRRTLDADDLFFAEDTLIKFSSVINEPLPRCPVEPTFSVHWLAVDGVQPRIPQNPSVSAQLVDDDVNRASNKKPKLSRHAAPTRSEPIQRPIVKHILSKEQQLYYKNVTDAVRGSDDVLKKAALKSLSSDDGLHQLLPFFTQFIADMVTHHLKELPLLRSLMAMAQSLISSVHLHVEPYLHQLMPPILTCLVGKRLCLSPTEDHWSLRQYCAGLVQLVCERFGAAYTTLQPRITKTLSRAWMDPSKPLTTHYGAIVGLASFGHKVTRAIILPYLRVYLQLLRNYPCQDELKSSKNPMKQKEAMFVYGALLQCSGEFVRREYSDLRWLPSLVDCGQSFDEWRISKSTLRRNVDNLQQEKPILSHERRLEGCLLEEYRIPTMQLGPGSRRVVLPLKCHWTVLFNNYLAFSGRKQEFQLRRLLSTTSALPMTMITPMTVERGGTIAVRLLEHARRNNHIGLELLARRASQGIMSSISVSETKEKVANVSGDSSTSEHLTELFELFGECIIPYTHRITPHEPPDVPSSSPSLSLSFSLDSVFL